MPRTTPRERRHARTREQILKAARGLLLERGHERLSLRAIAERADFSPAGLYEYFENKDAIVAALAERAQAPLAEALQRVLASPPEGEPALVAAGLAYVDFARAHPEDFLLLFSRLASRRRSVGEHAQPEGAYGLMLRLVARDREKGHLSAAADVDPEAIAYAVWAAAHGAAMLQLTHLAGFEADFAAADRALLGALVRGFGP